MTIVIENDLNGSIGGFRPLPLDAPEVKGGSSRGLSFRLHWTSPETAMGDLTFRFADAQVWTVAPQTLDRADWDALLIGFARAWAYIRLEEAYPSGVTPDAPSQTGTEVSRSASDSESARTQMQAFRLHHNLSAWLSSGRRFPEMWFLREGNLMLMEAGGRTFRWAYGDVIRTLERLGDAIATRLTKDGDPSEAVRLWGERENVEDAKLQAISLGMKESRVVQLSDVVARQRAPKFSGLDEVAAAARMVGAFVDDTVVRQIAAEIRARPFRETKQLSIWARQAAEVLSGVAEELPRTQGRDVARWLRKSVSAEDIWVRVDPAQVLAGWSVETAEIRTDERIEAISFWGKSHGPAVLINRSGRRNGSTGDGAIRFTLAHELGHLLLDTKGSLPLAEVLGGSVPSDVEERANSFAAEFLLPEEAAGDAYRNSPDVKEAFQRLSGRFGVTHTLAAWQILKFFGEASPALRAADRTVLLRKAGHRRF
jgi:hypothetical protein